MDLRRRACRWSLALALVFESGCLARQAAAALRRPYSDVAANRPLAELIAPRAPMALVQRFRVAALAAGDEVRPGQLVGLYEVGDNTGHAVGVAEVVDVGERGIELVALWIELEQRHIPLGVGALPRQSFGGRVGHIGHHNRGAYFLDIGRVQGVQAGDLYVALSTTAIPREVGLLRVAMIERDGTARATLIRGEAATDAQVRWVGHEAEAAAPLRVLVAQFAGDSGAEYGPALKSALERVASEVRSSPAELEIEAAEVVVEGSAGAAALARKHRVDVVVWGRAQRAGKAVALELGVEFADPRRREEQRTLAGMAADRTRTLTDASRSVLTHARELAPLIAGWAIHSELEIRGGGASARAAVLLEQALAASDPAIVAEARSRLFSCRLAMRDWAGAARLLAAIGDTDPARRDATQLMHARLDLEAGAHTPAHDHARAVATRMAARGDRSGAAEAWLLVAEVLHQRHEFAAAQALLEESVVPASAALAVGRTRGRGLALLAEIRDRRGAPDEALKIYREQVMPLLDALGETGARAVIAGKLAELERRRGHTEAALELLREASSVLTRLGDDAGRAAIRGQLAAIFAEQGETVDARRLYELEVLPTLQQIGDLRGYVRARSAVAALDERANDMVAALAIYRQALHSYELLGDDRGRVDVQLRIAVVGVANHQYETSLAVLETEVLPRLAHVDDSHRRAVVLMHVADLHRLRGAPERALHLLVEQVLPALGSPYALRARAWAQLRVAALLREAGLHDEALHLLRDEVLPAFERVTAVGATARTMHEIAEVYHHRHDLDDALRIYEEVAPVLGQIEDHAGRVATLRRIADIRRIRGEFERALEIRRDIEFAACHSEQCQARVLGGMIEIAIATGEYDQALELLVDKLQPLIDKLGDAELKTKAILQLAEIHLDTDAPGKAMVALEEVLPGLPGWRDGRLAASTLILLARVQSAQGSHEGAVATLRERSHPLTLKLADPILGQREQVVLAQALLRRRAPRDRKEATSLLAQALTTAQRFEAAGEIKTIRKIAEDHGLTQIVRRSEGR